ncbi:MAG TPA: aminotransferase class V-fold PLP-dependent enzyme [Solirubrobacteraceae bacterium]|nr:aminotransferase class V-fold PLP-dependent enzyme [Solirubrobacteraceae bacterium]
MSIETLRQEFPVLERVVYLNAGTDGPIPAAAARAGAEELLDEARRGRAGEHFERRRELAGELRAAYARALACDPTELALTTCTSEGLASVIEGLQLAPEEEILTSDEEHPGLLGTLGAARALRGVSVRAVALERIAEAVSERTRLVACSHVSWMSGALAPAELAQLEVPVLLDGAQGVGAVPCDVRALGCVAYAGAGQKWLCGPDGLGMLWVAPEFRERLQVSRRGYGNLLDPGAGLEASLHEDGRRFEAFALSAEALAAALAAVQTLERAGWQAVHERALALAARLVEQLGEAGRDVVARGPSTLVSFASADPIAERERLAGMDIVLRDIPGRPHLRASVGAWNDESDLQRLLAALGGRSSMADR